MYAGETRLEKPQAATTREDLMKEIIVQAFEESVRVKQAFLRDNIDALVFATDAIVAAFRNGNKLLLFGNGGSAADAQHIATGIRKPLSHSSGRRCPRSL